jgi:hypothetical protein
VELALTALQLWEEQAATESHLLLLDQLLGMAAVALAVNGQRRDRPERVPTVAGTVAKMTLALPALSIAEAAEAAVGIIQPDLSLAAQAALELLLFVIPCPMCQYQTSLHRTTQV